MWQCKWYCVVAGYENIHENLAKIELEALTLLEVVQSTESNISDKVEKEGDKIAALEIADNLLWLQVNVLEYCVSFPLWILC